MAGEAIPDMLRADYAEARKDEAVDAEARKREEDQRMHEQIVSGAGADDPSGGGHTSIGDTSIKDTQRIDTHDAHEMAAVKREAEKQVEEIASKMPKADKAI
jgi:hypothetical protein